MKRILVTEDDPCLQDIYKIILEKAGYEVELRSDGQDIMNNKFTLPDLFLLDKQLSGMDGLDICKYLKHLPATRHLPVIVISATVDIQRLVEAAGADAYIEKPFDKKHFLTVVAENLSRTTHMAAV